MKFGDFRRNFGQGAAMSGVAMWTTDIGGYAGGNPDEPSFQQMIVRWFQVSPRWLFLSLWFSSLWHSVSPLPLLHSVPPRPKR